MLGASSPSRNNWRAKVPLVHVTHTPMRTLSVLFYFIVYARILRGSESTRQRHCEKTLWQACPLAYSTPKVDNAAR